jgi:TRAP-type C4-dicarboxylate transport system substrate-binding protein
MYLHAHGPGLLHGKKLIKSMEDMKGVKVRCYGFNARVVEALGGVPVAMSQAEVYEALQKGVVEATFSPVEVLKGWKQAEVTEYTVDSDGVGYTSGLYVVMNRQKWESLPKDVQKVIEEVNLEWIDKTGDAWDEADKVGREFALSLGHKFIPLSKEETARWIKTVKPVIDKYASDAEAKGLPGKAYVEFIAKAVEKYKGQM